MLRRSASAWGGAPTGQPLVALLWKLVSTALQVWGCLLSIDSSEGRRCPASDAGSVAWHA